MYDSFGAIKITLYRIVVFATFAAEDLKEFKIP